jgi:hypothetical protein
MDDTAFTELDLIMRFKKTVKDKKTNIVKIHILGTDSDGLSKIMVNVNEVPCLPSWPKPRLFVCPGVKQVKYCPSQTQPHYLILGNPEAVVLTVQKRLLKKANKMLQQILLQLDSKALDLHWRSLIVQQPSPVMPQSPLALLSSLHSDYMEPKSAQSEASMSAVSPLVIFTQPVHCTRYIATPTTSSQPITVTDQQAVKSSGGDNGATMPILVR